MMPLLFSMGQHPALEAVQAQLIQGEFLFAYLDDIYVVNSPKRTGTMYTLLQHALWRVAGICIHQGKTKIWNRVRVKPESCDALERMAHIEDPTSCVWRGSEVPTVRQGMKVLGTPVGHMDFVRNHLERTSADHQLLMDRISMLEDLQSSWLLLVHCAAARANYMMRAVELEAAQDSAPSHKSRSHITTTRRQRHRVNASHIGRPWVEECGSHKQAYWASWADCFSMVQQRHPHVAAALVTELQGSPTSSFLQAASQCRAELTGKMEFAPPSWLPLHSVSDLQ